MRKFSLIIVFAISLISCNTFNRHLIHQPSTFAFLVPPHVEGPLIIIYAESCGIQPQIKEGKATFQFESNGAVIIKDELDLTTINEFYLLDSAGNRTKATEIASLDKRINNEPVVIQDVLRYTSSNVFYVNSELKNKEGGATCKWYHLYTKNTFQSFDKATTKRLDSLTNEIVRACRSKFYAGK